jgi:micrococcal nuclease
MVAVVAGLLVVKLLIGPVPADVVAVPDGDTMQVRAHIWPGQWLEVSVRLRGIDAPEMRARCPRERRLAEASRARLTDAGRGTVLLWRIQRDKYGGRVIADVTDQDQADLGALLVSEGHARPYDGGQRQSWCDDP